jgi:hypothetical protein
MEWEWIILHSLPLIQEREASTSENLMSLREEERNPKTLQAERGKNKRLTLRTEQILIRNYQNILRVSDFDVTYWCGLCEAGQPIVISVERLD